MKPRGRKPTPTDKRKVITLRLFANNYNALLLAARRSNLSLNEFCVQALSTNPNFAQAYYDVFNPASKIKLTKE